MRITRSQFLNRSSLLLLTGTVLATVWNMVSADVSSTISLISQNAQSGAIQPHDATEAIEASGAYLFVVAGAFLVACLFLTVFQLKIWARRYRDIGRSPWNSLFIIIPFVNIYQFFRMALKPSDADNRYGSTPRQALVESERSVFAGLAMCCLIFSGGQYLNYRFAVRPLVTQIEAAAATESGYADLSAAAQGEQPPATVSGSDVRKLLESSRPSERLARKSDAEPQHEKAAEEPFEVYLQGDAPCDARDAVERVQNFNSQGRPVHALALTREFRQKCGELLELRWAEFNAHKLAGQREQALQVIDELMTDYPGDKDYPGWKGLYLESLGELDGALEAFQLAMDIEPALKNIPLNMTTIPEKQKRYCEAHAVLLAYINRYAELRSKTVMQAWLKRLSDKATASGTTCLV